MTRAAALLALLALSACADTALNERSLDSDVPNAEGRLRIDVYPPADLALTDELGALLDLRPQTYFEEVTDDGATVVLTITPAVAVGGVVEGIALTPFPSADVPTVAGTLGGAEIRFGQEDGIQQPRALTADDGVYDVPVVPSELEYAVAIIPATPYVPIHQERVAIDGSTGTLDLFIDLGVPLWGELLDSRGNPLPGMPVQVETDQGIAGPESLTDADGRYLIAVLADQEYTVISTPENPRDPVLRRSTGLIPEGGARVDLIRGSDLVGTLSGTILSPDGGVVGDDDVRIRIVSTELDGYGEGTRGSIVRETSTFRGDFDAVVPIGTYRIELAPLAADGPSPLALDEVVVSTGQVDLGRIELEPLTPRFGEVLDDDASTVAGAIVTCTEVGFAGRSWSATTDPSGQFILSAPSTPSTCTVAPPGARTDLALTRQPIDAELAMDEAARWTLWIRPGSVVSGVVNVRGEASLMASPVRTLPGAVVEVRDAAGNLLGIAVSDDDGRFSIRVAQ